MPEPFPLRTPESPAPINATEDESGVRIKPRDEGHELKKDPRKLFIGTTKEILKNYQTELELVKEILELSDTIESDDTGEAEPLNKELHRLRTQYEKNYASTVETDKKAQKSTNFPKRLDDLNIYIAKQEDILERAKRALKTSPPPVSASGR